MSCVSDPLVAIQWEEWFELKDRFKENWPFGLTAYNTILTQYFNVKKDPNFPVKVFSVFGDPDNGVICIWRQVPDSFEIIIFCMQNDTSKITEALVKTKQIDWTIRPVFCTIMKEHVKCCVDALNQLGIEDPNIDCTYIAHVKKEIALKYNVELPEGFSLQVLPPEKADELDRNWPHRHPGSLVYFETMLSRGAALGLINNNGDLTAWGLISNRGDLHAITTKPEYRKKGYAQIIIKTLSKRLAEEGKEIYGCIVLANEPSKKLFTGLGFTFTAVGSFIHPVPKK